MTEYYIPKTDQVYWLICPVCGYDVYIPEQSEDFSEHYCDFCEKNYVLKSELVHTTGYFLEDKND
jgi:hypothetical protein